MVVSEVEKLVKSEGMGWCGVGQRTGEGGGDGEELDGVGFESGGVDGGVEF